MFWKEIDQAVENTEGKGCLWIGFLGQLLKEFKNSVIAAISSSQERVKSGTEISKKESDPTSIAIQHTQCVKFFQKLVDTVAKTVKAKGTEKRCLTASEVKKLKEEVAATVDQPPKTSLGQSLAKYRRFVEGKYSNQM